jgi:polyphenol oxidase
MTMNRHEHNDLAYYTFPSLEPFTGLVHGITTRHGGVSAGPYTSLNLSNGLGDDPAAVAENLRRACAAFGVRREHLVSPNQRHTANVRRVGAADRGRIWPNYDTLITDEPGVPLLLRYADCTPVLIYDPAHHALALIHSGWRGTVQGAARVAVDALAAEFGSRPTEMVAAIGPSIGPCCYEVGEDVISAVQATFDRPAELLLSRNGSGPLSGRAHFDLWAANRRWVADAGVRQIEAAQLCTACRTDDFYSYRAERGKTGHFGAVAMLRA